jgi:DNA-directed RNA polymerase specialized sigma24 family protein
MSEQRYSRASVRKARRSLASMNDLQREVFCAMRFEADMTYAKLAERHGLTEVEVQCAFAGALYVLARAIREPEPWWRRWWPW